MILDGKQTSLKIQDRIKKEIQEKNINACLAVIFIGDNHASEVYVRNKEKACERCGIKFKKFKYDSNTSEEEIIKTIYKINNDKNINGVIVQLPVPEHISLDKILETIDPLKDVDGFTFMNIGKMFYSIKKEILPPATPGGIIMLLDEYNIDVKGMNTVIIGRSNIVGKPIATMLTNRSATVTICHSKTKDISFYTKKADLIIVAVGIPKFLKADMVENNPIIIDVGINKDENGKLCGDIDFDNLKEKARAITPVPGGVGPMTIAQLMMNVLKSANI